MKIAFLHFWTFRLPRGVETLTISLANALARRGCETHILCARSKREPLVKPLPEVKAKQFPTFRYYEAATIVPFYASALIKEQYDFVITFFADFGEGWALRLAKPFLKKTRHVLYLTFPYESAPHRYQAYQAWKWDKTADILLADAEYTARGGANLFGRKVINLPSGTDPARFFPDPERRAQKRRELGFADDELVLLNVSALEPRKGTWRVVEAMPQILERAGSVRYLILGDGPQRNALEARAKELGVAERILFAGTTSNLAPYYNAADVFVMLSDSEAGSIACLEAMSSGLPVIVSDAGGFGEVATPECGRMIDINLPRALAEAVAELRDSALREERGRNARRRIVENFSWDALAERLLSILNE